MLWLREHQLESIKLFFPKARDVSRVEGPKVLSVTIHVLRPGLCFVDAPTTCGAHKTHCNRFRRWSEKGSCKLIFSELA